MSFLDMSLVCVARVRRRMFGQCLESIVTRAPILTPGNPEGGPVPAVRVGCHWLPTSVERSQAGWSPKRQQCPAAFIDVVVASTASVVAAAVAAATASMLLPQELRCPELLSY